MLPEKFEVKFHSFTYTVEKHFEGRWAYYYEGNFLDVLKPFEIQLMQTAYELGQKSKQAENP